MKRFLLLALALMLAVPVFAVDYQTEFGLGNETRYFEWDNEGVFDRVESPTEGKTTITVKYNSSNLQGKFTNEEVLPEKNLSGDFYDLEGKGGIINSYFAEIGDVSGNFVNNYSTYSDGGSMHYDARGGAINNNGIIRNINGVFIGNVAATSAADGGTNYGGAIFNGWDGKINSITADFIGNRTLGFMGGAIYNEGEIGQVKGNFIGNCSFFNDPDSAFYSGDGFGGAINNSEHGIIDSIQNSAFIANQNTAIYNSGTIKNGIINSIFKDNYYKSRYYDTFGYGDRDVYGGAIYTDKSLDIIANDGGVTEFTGNYVIDTKGYRPEAIYVGKSYYSHEQDEVVLTLNANTNGKIILNDQINGYNGFKLSITGDKTGNVNINNDILNADITLNNTNLNLTKENWLNASSLTMNSGTMSLINNEVGISSPTNLTVTGNTNLLVDVDLANKEMDRFETSNYGNHTGNIVVSGMNLLSDAKEEHTEIYFAQSGLKDNVESGIVQTNKDFQTTAYTPIYKYNVSYDKRDDAGYFLFDKAGPSSTNTSDNYNPAVLDSPVATQAGGQSVVNETVRFAFQHIDLFSQMPYVERMAYINQNKYAITEGIPRYSADFEKLNKGYWIKPFTSFERINLHRGPDVDAITYGTLVGFDSNFRELKHGWYNVQSVYGGYNGSQLSYSGVDTNMNGGLLGLTETFYKNNFFGALTATAGSSFVTSSTMYGNEDYAMLLGGVGAKGGYNFEFRNGKYILQPIMFANYSFVNTFDYTNAAGVRIKSDPLHTFQVNPQLKFVANLDKGWQPYASVGFVWNILNTSKVRANEVILPKMSVDPYVEYGLGVQQNWKDKYTGFLQAMVRNGGRNGVALTFGFRWALGKVDDI